MLLIIRQIAIYTYLVSTFPYTGMSPNKQFSGIWQLNKKETVLGEFSEEDEKVLPERFDMCNDIIKSFCLAGLQNTMNQFNNK